MTVQTRTSSSAPIFGTKKDIDPDNAITLPTYEDVIRCFHSVRLKQKYDGIKQPSKFSIAAIVAQKVETVWKRASIPFLSRKRVVDMIVGYHTKYQNIIKPIISRDSKHLSSKLSVFKNRSGKLFDISTCKCKGINACKCNKSRKIPKREFNFLIDQRTDRQMVIGRADKHLSKKFTEQQNRKENQASKTSIKTDEPGASTGDLQRHTNIHQDEMSFSSSENTEEMDEENDEEFKWSYDLLKNRKLKKSEENVAQMRIPLVHTAKAADLTGISNRSAAKIATAVLEDMKIVCKEKRAKVVDKNKIRRALFKNRNELKNKWSSNKKSKCLEAIYFDGRKDQTIVDLNRHRKKKLEEHISLIQEPGSQYFGHISLNTSSKATDIASSILSFMKQNDVDLTNLKVIGCDGTNCNTGWKGGVIRLMETQLGKPLQWAVCYLHANELPLRHLLQKLDGHTKGPYQYSGEIGSLLGDCEKPIDEIFKKPENLRDLNTIDIGSAAKSLITQARFTEKDRVLFYKGAQQHFVAAVKHLVTKSSLKTGSFLKHCRCLNPLKVQSHEPRSILKIAEKLPLTVNSTLLSNEWILMKSFEDFTTLLDESKPKTDILFNFWNSVFKRINEIDNSPKYPNLTKVVKSALSLSHGNAGVERGFSRSKLILSEDKTAMTLRTLNARLDVASALAKYQNKPHLVPIAKELLEMARMAHKSYQMYLTVKKEKDKKQADQIRLEEERLEMERQRAKKAKAEKRSIETLETELQVKRKSVRESSLAGEELVKQANKRLEEALCNNNLHEVRIAQVMLEGYRQIKQKKKNDVKDLQKIEKNLSLKRTKLMKKIDISKKLKRDVV
ncbi:unnamed protein product [Brassicogethes aeneus]|uniref:Uncharacterized protein n=1 Tax=Brassicogethes aeneus TaxID=1431903 RepID=A0A9P0BGX3_BRAAE|nr:unnamed protein product [Brassicogethes aeneus]